ncbi:helix-turn-helix domain-containing protein [Nocardia sp. NPDC058058]|uniref:helix-turn-helix domain-containing protein n=1 Tax=Nocardia sp. NPDC058058 TaxID=3346317 RepID=UPI0036DB9142
MDHREQGREALAQELRQLRGERPELSLRAIGQRAQVSHTTVSRAFSVEDKLPSWPSIAAITEVLGGATGEIEPLWLWASTGTPPTRLITAPLPPRPAPRPWFTPVCAVATVGLMILAIAHSAIPPQTSADRWLGDIVQAVIATAAAIAFGVRARQDRGSDRRWLIFACLATVCWTVGMACWIAVHEIGGDHDRGTAITELGFHAYSLLMIGALWLRNAWPTRIPNMTTMRSVALIAVAALSVPSLIWLLAAFLDTVSTGTDDAQIRLTYLYPIADGAMLAMALFGALTGTRIIQSWLFATAFGVHAAASILATTYITEDVSTDLVASSEFGFTTFTVLLALAAIAPMDSRTRPERHLDLAIRALQAGGLIAIAIYILALATGHLPPAITSYIAAALILLLIVALVAGFNHRLGSPQR